MCLLNHSCAALDSDCGGHPCPQSLTQPLGKMSLYIAKCAADHISQFGKRWSGERMSEGIQGWCLQDKPPTHTPKPTPSVPRAAYCLPFVWLSVHIVKSCEVMAHRHQSKSLPARGCGHPLAGSEAKPNYEILVIHLCGQINRNSSNQAASLTCSSHVAASVRVSCYHSSKGA